jgi:hypothetical protein
MSAAQLIQDHWRFIQRITDDADQAQQLALHVLEKFEQFQPDRGEFSQFIKLKLRELRQHYSDKGVVDHPCRKESGGYVSLDETFNSDYPVVDDEEIERDLYNLFASSWVPQGVSDEIALLIIQETKSRRPAHCETVNSVGRCPEPVKLRPRVKRLSREAFRRELVGQAADAPRMKARIYYAERAAGQRPLPKDRLWESEVASFLSAYWKAALKSLNPWRIDSTIVERRAGHSWHRLDGKDQWEGLAYLRDYLARNGMAHPLPRRRRKPAPILEWLPILGLAKRLQQRASPREDTNLLWAALRVLCYKRAWPPGIPAKKIYPEDEFSPRERLLRQAKHVLIAAGLKVPARRPLRRNRQHTETTVHSVSLHQ